MAVKVAAPGVRAVVAVVAGVRAVVAGVRALEQLLFPTGANPAPRAANSRLRSQQRPRISP